RRERDAGAGRGALPPQGGCEGVRRRGPQQRRAPLAPAPLAARNRGGLATLLEDVCYFGPMSTDKKLGFIGAGNMGEALFKGLLSTKAAKPGQILVSARRPERVQELVTA